ncbi:MAG: PSD1 domain-containing protein [Planctomycetes bacterium]|nr:PSD1 domain-containing protein [Planctomycetota bacterium]
MKRGLVLLAVVVCGMTTATAAETPKTAVLSAADREFFERKVRPLLSQHCYQCHSTKSKKQRGGLLLDSRSTAMNGGDSGPVIVPGRPDDSLLIRAVRHKDERVQMPPKGKLPDRDIAVLVEWVRRGAPFPDAGPAVTTGRTIDLVEGRKFWSFQPLRLGRSLALPAVRDRSWASRRIDTFLLAAMERRGLAPSPPADRRTLIRRVCFDLIGLPPSPEEVEAFVADRRPDAYEMLVERLLASPHHGERWARFWLDLGRYCDIAEPWATTKGHPFVYRDWIVRALNADVPYDRFVALQLAADQVSGARPEDHAALAFLGLSPTYWKELKLDKDVIKTVVAEEWEERIHTVASTFLGLTVACARCHDHKFDPITQKDYYALAGIFASTREADRPIIPEPDATKVLKARDEVQKLQEQIDKLRKGMVTPASQQQVRDLESRIARLERTTPYFNTGLAPGVEDASLFVLPDGPHKTKLEYKPGVAQDVPMQVRGNPANPGPVVPRRFLSVLSPAKPKPFQRGSGRLELATAIVNEGASLAARVIVNRVWEHHFGRGLVETPSNFGMEGARPSHPQLLDDLAVRFVASGWSLKWLHREIVLSSAYREVGQVANLPAPKAGWQPAPQETIDPDNRWLWRANPRRLEIEAWRDAMLAATGSLDRHLGGAPLDLGAADNHRRTLYGTIKRRELHDMLRLHDFPDPTTHSAGRTPTTTPLQQLFVLNSPFVQQQAATLSRRLHVEASDTEARVRRAYRLLFARPATDAEVKLAVEFLTPASEAAWQQYAQVLLGSNEFLFID